jgi:hypothetical protein
MCHLSVILVNWNAGSQLLSTLSALYQALVAVPQSEVILVDNASTDNSAQLIMQEFPQLKIIHNPTNFGFGTANNVGFAQARGHYVLLVNPDLRVNTASLETMLNFMETHPRAGMCGPKILESDGVTISPWCARHDPRPQDVFFEYSFLYRLFPQHHLFARYVMGDWDHASDSEVESLTGACLLVRHEVIEQTGGFDEQFFMYGEDLDWCRRIRLAGWQVWFVADAKVTHIGGHSTQQTSDHGAYWGMESHLRYFRKWGSSADVFRLRLALSSGCIIRAMSWLGISVIRPRQFRYTFRRAIHYLYYTLLTWTT